MRSLRWNHLWNQYPAHMCGCLSSSRSYSIYLIEHAPISSLLPSFLVRVFTMFNKPSGGHGGTVWLWVPVRQNLISPNPGPRNHKGPWLLVPSHCLMLFWTFAQGGVRCGAISIWTWTKIPHGAIFQQWGQICFTPACSRASALLRPWNREVSWGSSEKLLFVTSDNRTQLASLEILQKVKGF